VKSTLSLLSLVFVSNMTLIAATFEWKSNQESISVNEPLKAISSLVEEEMKQVIYAKKPINITAAVPAEITKPIMPAEVKKPEFPESLELKRGEFEKSSDFDKRVAETSKKRETELKVLQENYRLHVQLRNEKIEQLSQQYNEDVKKRNTILQRLQDIHKKDMAQLEGHYIQIKKTIFNDINLYSKKAIDKIYGKAKVSFNSYNADAEVMYLTLSSFDSKNFSKDIEIHISPSKAKILKDNIENLVPSVIFSVYVDEEKHVSYSIQKITLEHDKKAYVASDSSSKYMFEPTLVTIENRTTTMKRKNKVLALQDTDTEFELQNPNLNDTFSLGAVALSSSGAILGNNILVNKLQDVEKSKIDKSKWIFMIAVEDYAETDDVIYAKRSAIAMKKAMQTRFGVSERHTYALMDEKATSGAIKDKLCAMLQNVKEKDTIYFYYSGHGIPAKSGDAYILPQDKIVDFIDKDPFFKLENIYAMLSESKAEHSFAFIDSCFSGKTDDVLVFKGVAPGLIQSKKAVYNHDKMTIITAGLNDEFSNMYKSKRYRLFSYYLTEALIDNISDIELLYKKVNYKVSELSNEMGDRYTQNPQMYGSKKVRLY